MLAARLLLSGMVVVVGSTAAKVPTRCCLDKQYSVDMGVVGEVLSSNPSDPVFIDGAIHRAFDYYTDRMLMKYRFRQPDGSYGIRTVIKDYAQRRAYTTVNNGTCTYAPLDDFDVLRPPCIPANATYFGSSVLGYGHNILPVFTWSFTIMVDANTPSQMILSVTQDHCVPVTESMIGPYHGTPIEQTVFFVNYHPGIEQHNNLQPPANCQPAPTTH